MIPCPACGCHVRSASSACPHCAAELRQPRFGGALFGFALLGLVGCVGDTKTSDSGATSDTGTPVIQPPYGVPTTETDVAPTGETGSASGSGTGGSGTGGSGTGGSGTSGSGTY